MADEPNLQAQFDAALAELKPKQRTFVQEYLHDLHGQNAAIRAGYSKATARSQASRLLTNVNIRAAVNLGMQLVAMPAPEVIARLSDEARADMADFLRVDEEEITVTWSLLSVPTTEDGEPDMLAATLRLAGQEHVQPTDRVLRTETITRSVARLDLMEAGRRGKLGLIKEYTLDDKGNVKIKLHDAHAARVELAKIHGLLVERQEISGPNGGPIEIDDARDQLADKLTRRLAASDPDPGAPGDPGAES